MQQTVTPAVVTPSGVREGHPAALQGLCERRGASVMAYCREVCAPEDAARAAAEAFARFRAAVVALDDVTAIDPEALLLSATRHAAASLATVAPVPRARRWRRRGQAQQPEGCPETAELLIGRVEGTLSDAEQQQLTAHLEQCEACRALKDMFRHAEVLYRDPGDSSVPPVVVRAILDALAAAAPVAGQAPPEAVADEPEEDPHGLEPEEAEVEPYGLATEYAQAGGALEFAEEEPYGFRVDEEQDQEEDEPEPPRRRLRRRRKTLAFPPVAPDEPDAVEDEEPELDGEPSPVDMPPVAPDDEAAMARVFPEPGAPRSRSGRGLPRTPRHPAHSHPHPRHHGRVRAIVLPGGIVLVAVAGALGIAGVFGGDEASPPSGNAVDDQLFPTAVLRAPARGTAAAAAAEIARLAELERRRAARARRLRQQGVSVSTAGGALASPPTPSPTPTRPSAKSAAAKPAAKAPRSGDGVVPGADGPATAR